MALITSRLGTSSSSCLGALKSFLATITPSNYPGIFNINPVRQNQIRQRTLEEVLIDGTPVLLRDDHNWVGWLVRGETLER